jgi:D-3-phosphoglycerate dehydrogenase
MRAVFIDATNEMGDVFERLLAPGDPPIAVNRQARVRPEEIPAIVGDAATVVIDHTALPTEIARACPKLRHVVFLGTGARSYMNVEELESAGISVDTIRGYGDTAVAECAFALLWSAARDLAAMDRAIRQGKWPLTRGVQLTGKTIGLVGFGGIGAEMARLALGAGMKVLAWNRTGREMAGVAFTSLDRLLAESHAISLHLLLNEQTRGFLSRERIARMRPGAILVNTARGALVDEAALVEALQSGRIAHAGLDVFAVEPLPAGHPLTALENVTLSAHSAFRTPEATENLLRAGIAHCRRRAG